jgi:SAM-dependent methyltransferase
MFATLVKRFKHFLHLSDGIGTYPVLVSRRDVNSQMGPPGKGTELFDQQKYLEINEARMRHLESLKLPLKDKTVLDVGCGIGHLAQFFVRRGCRVVCVDGRQENIDELRSRYPGIKASVIDVEKDSLDQFGTFDIIFCYGLLYHLENPLAALRNMAPVCKELLLLETIICDHIVPILRIVEESLTVSQALRGLGYRPSPSYVAMALNRVGFPFVYMPKTPPEHPEFRFKWENNIDWHRDGHHLRCIFIGSKTQQQNPGLISLISD